MWQEREEYFSGSETSRNLSKHLSVREEHFSGSEISRNLSEHLSAADSAEAKQVLIAPLVNEDLCHETVGNDVLLAKKLFSYLVSGNIVLPDALIDYLCSRFFEYLENDFEENRSDWLIFLSACDLIWKKTMNYRHKVFFLFNYFPYQEEIIRFLEKIAGDQTLLDKLFSSYHSGNHFFIKLKAVDLTDHQEIKQAFNDVFSKKMGFTKIASIEEWFEKIETHKKGNTITKIMIWDLFKPDRWNALLESLDNVKALIKVVFRFRGFVTPFVQRLVGRDGIYKAQINSLEGVIDLLLGCGRHKRTRSRLLQELSSHEKVLDWVTSNAEVIQVFDAAYSNEEKDPSPKACGEFLQNVWKHWGDEKSTLESLIDLCLLAQEKPYGNYMLEFVFSSIDISLMFTGLPNFINMMRPKPLAFKSKMIDDIRAVVSSARENIKPKVCQEIAERIKSLLVFSMGEGNRHETHVNVKNTEQLLQFLTFARTVCLARVNEKTNSIYIQLLLADFDKPKETQALMLKYKETSLLVNNSIVVNTPNCRPFTFSLRHCFCFVLLYRDVVFFKLKERLQVYMEANKLLRSIRLSETGFLSYVPYELSDISPRSSTASANGSGKITRCEPWRAEGAGE